MASFKMKQDIVNKLCSLSKALLAGRTEFNNQRYNKSIASGVYLKYLKYINDPNIPNKNALLDHFIYSSKYLIRDAILGNEPPYSNNHKRLLEAEDQFISWYFPKETIKNPGTIIDVGKLHKIDFNKVIVDEVSLTQPSFVYVKKSSKKYYLVFSKKIGRQEFFVIFVGGKKRAFFNVEVAFGSQEVNMDIGCLLARPQSMFDYTNVTELKKGVKDALIFVDLICAAIAK